MKLTRLSLFFLLVIYLSCDKSDSPDDNATKICGVTDPVNQLPWLNDLINSRTSCEMYDGAKIYSYTYNGKQMFYLSNGASSIYICAVSGYNCNGSRFDIVDLNEFASNRTNEILIREK